MVFVEAAALPRGASVEWQITFRRALDEVDSDDEDSVAVGARRDQARKRSEIVVLRSGALLLFFDIGLG